MAANDSPVPEPVLMRIGDFITTASDAIPAAGLLTDKPELIEAELPADQWAKHMAAYMASERP